MKMVAERAGVSVATVSFVLSGRRGRQAAASSTTVARVRAAAADLGYRPNQAARAIRTGRSGLVLLSLHQLDDPWCQSVSRAVNAASAGRQLQPLILADGDWGEVLDGQPVDVAFLDDGTAADLPRIRGLVGRGLRLVVFSDTLEPDGFDVISSPQRPGCELAITYLLSRHTRIACLAGSDPARPGWHREQAYLDGLAAAGLRMPADYLQRYPRDQAGAYEAALRLLDRDDPPTAVFASSDFAAMITINVALRLGFSVPADCVVVGVGNTEQGRLMHPSLTSVGPSDDFYDRLARLIIAIAEDPAQHPPTRHDFPWSLHLRASTAG